LNPKRAPEINSPVDCLYASAEAGEKWFDVTSQEVD